MYTFMINPASRSGRGQKYWDRIRPVLEEKGVPYRALFSEKSGDMTRMAEALTAPEPAAPEFAALKPASPDGELHLVVLGGDGTVNEVLQGIRDFSGTRFSYIPTGSSNDLARDTGISRDPLKALAQILENPSEHPMDVGVLHYNKAYETGGASLSSVTRPDRRFLVSCGIGFDAGVCQQAMHSVMKNTLNRLGLGKLTYLGIALRQLVTSGHAQAQVTVHNPDGSLSCDVSLDRLMFVACMSHCYEGGGFYFCPGADASDGILDLCTVSGVPKWKVVLVLPTAFSGNHYRYQGVERQTGSNIRITASRPLWVHTDGEVTALSDDISISCCRKLLRFYY